MAKQLVFHRHGGQFYVHGSQHAKALHSLEILGEDSHAGSICVSLDRTRVHYVLHDKHWLLTDGKTEELHLRE
jgi:hypothetical protein